MGFISVKALELCHTGSQSLECLLNVNVFGTDLQVTRRLLVVTAI